MKEKLPEVTSLKVPEELTNYPLFALNLSNIFNNKNLTQEDLKRTDMYKAQVLREQKLKESDSLETYLQSLEMKLSIFYDSKIS